MTLNTTPATAPPPAPAPPADKPAAEKKPSRNPVVHVRPLAAAAGNAATIGGATAVHAGGPWALAAIAAVAAVGAGAAARTRVRSNRAASGSAFRTTRTTTSGGRRTGMPHLGLGRSTSGRAASAGIPAGRRGGTAATAGRRTGGARTGLGRGGSGLSGLRGRAPGLGGKSGSGKLTPGKVARARRLLADRKARDAARRARHKLRGETGQRRQAAADQARARRDAQREHRRTNPGWWRRWWRARTGRTTKPDDPATTTPGNKTGREPAVGDTARRGTTDPGRRTPRRPAQPPAGHRPAGSRPATPTGPAIPAAAASGGPVSAGPSVMRALLALAEEMKAVAIKHERPEGVMQLIQEYEILPEVLDVLTEAWTAWHTRATDPHDGDPLNPAVMDLLAEIAKTQRVAAHAAAEVAPLARRLEAARIEALRDRRNRMWDLRANDGYAA